MKKLLLPAAFMIPMLARSQAKQDPFNYRAQDRYLYYQDVVMLDTTFTVTDLYKDAKLFITKLALVNTKITTDDATSGTVAADMEEPSAFKTQTGIGDEPMTVKYAIKLELKKGRYRYTFDNIQISYADNGKTAPHSLYDMDKEKGGGLIGVGKNKRVLKAMDALFLQKISLLKTTMSKKSDDF